MLLSANYVAHLSFVAAIVHDRHKGDRLLGALRVLVGCSTALAAFGVEDSKDPLVPSNHRAMASCTRVAPFSSVICFDRNLQVLAEVSLLEARGDAGASVVLRHVVMLLRRNREVALRGP